MSLHYIDRPGSEYGEEHHRPHADQTPIALGRVLSFADFLRVADTSKEFDAEMRPRLDKEQIQAACDDLRMSPNWQGVPRYGEYEKSDSEMNMLARLDEINESLARQAEHDPHLAAQLAADVEKSKAFIEKAFGCYRGEKRYELPAGAVFAVPTRVSRNDGERYNHEVTPFLPVAEHLDADVLQRFISALPPCVIESYEPRHGEQAHVLFTPVFTDMPADMLQNEIPGTEILATAQKIANDAAHFAKEVLDARVMGLGAVIPGFTRYGNTIEVPELLTTTGHGGTVALVEKTVEKVFEEVELPTSENVGVIGAGGSIGRSIVASLAERFPDKNVLISDVNPGKLESVKKFCADLGIDVSRINAAENNAEVIEGSSVIVSAATGTIDMNTELAGIDLKGKVFIDDSQPVCFDRVQAEERGASVLWVVGDGSSIDLRRVDGYNYGGEGSGIVGDAAAWGCELETQVVLERPELAVRTAVTPQIVTEINKAFDDVGITVAPFQSFGRVVALPKKQQQ